MLARCHCLSLYFHRSTQVLVKTLWSGNSIFYIKCLHIYTHSTQFCTCYSTTWCTYLSQAIYFHTETNSGNKIQVQNIYISFFNISKLDFGRQKTCMCSSSLNACANGYTLKCWLFFKIIQLLMLLSFGSCRNNCIMQCVGYHLAYMCSCFYFALPLLNQVISVSQPPSKSLFPATIFFFFFTARRENREHLATSHLLPPRAPMLGKISEVSWEAWLSLSLLCHCPACYSRGVFGMCLQVDPSTSENTVRFHLTLTDWHTQALCMRASLLSAKLGLSRMFCMIIFQGFKNIAVLF